MEVDIKIIGAHDINLLKIFLDEAGRSLDTFRYFKTRPYEIISNHIITALLVKENFPIGYCHLDKDGENIWLGIAISEKHIGYGYGSLLIEFLVDQACKKSIPEISLTVDQSNTNAISLYEKFGFRKISKINDQSLLMKLALREDKRKIFISTIAFGGMEIEEIVSIAKRNSWGIEFSSGLPYREDMDILFLDAEIDKLVHNYFPAPENPFVLNLASRNSKIRNLSINHCYNGLLLAKKVGAPFYSAHAGFCIDPPTNELGRQFTSRKGFDKGYCEKLFLQSIRQILIKAADLKIDFLIENNVISPFNLVDNCCNPLLCCDKSELLWLFGEITDGNFGILLDTGHLKVSCNTLNLDINEEVSALKRYVKAIHHSDNNGLSDNNLPINENYWFLKYMKYFHHATHIIEVQHIKIDSIKNQINLLRQYGC